MMKLLRHVGHTITVLGVEEKWSLWNITVIQADSGGSRTSADDAGPESKSFILIGADVKPV